MSAKQNFLQLPVRYSKLFHLPPLRLHCVGGNLLTCTCRGIPIAPSRRMLETLLLDEDSLLLTWSISTVFRVFNAVLCIFMGCFSSDFFFLCIRLFPLVFQQSFELLDIFCLSGFSGQLVPWLCHSHTETVSSHLCPCILVDQV